jgi:hypothetical protein
MFNSREEKLSMRMAGLLMFLNEHGRYPVGSSQDENERLLSQWVSNIRNRYNAGYLRDDLLEFFENLPVKMSWNLQKDAWDNFYEMLKGYLKEHGRLPKKLRYDSTGLSQWCCRQWARYKENKLTQDRIDKLDELEGWTWESSSTSWHGNYKSLCNFFQENNALPGFTNKPEEEKKIYRWVGQQIVLYKKGSLDKERISLLRKFKDISKRLKKGRGKKSC